MTDQSQTVRTLLATLVAGGVRHVVVSPGSRSTPLVQAAAERPELTLHVVLDERSGGFFALGLARASRGLVATLCTSGSAAAHVLPAAIEATESGDALIAITADRPAGVRGLGASQAILQPGLLAPYASHFAEIDATDATAPVQLAEVQTALQTLPSAGGVIHINVPLAMPLALTAGAPAALPPQLPRAAQVPSPTLATPLAGEKLLILAGPLPHDPDLADWLSSRVPSHAVLVAEAASRLHDLPSVVRHADALLRDADVRAALMPERIVRLGAWPISKGAQLLLEDAKRLGLPVDTVHPRRVSDPLRQNRQTLVGAITDALRDWPATSHNGAPTAWTQRWEAANRSVQAPDASWHEATAIAALVQRLPAKSTILLGNSMPVRDWDTFAPPLADGVNVEVSRGAAGIDGALATLAGLAVGSDRPVTAYLGDCTFLHDVGSLQLLAGQRLRHAGLRICVVDNDGGAIFDYLPARTAMAESLHVACFTTPHGLDLTAIARGFGLDARLCLDPATWQAALAEPVAANQVQILIAPFARTTSEALHRAYWHQVGIAARGALAKCV